MSGFEKLENPPVYRTSLKGVADLFEGPKELDDLAQKLRLIRAVLVSEYWTGREKGLRKLILLADACNEENAPEVLGKHSGFTRYWRDEVLKEHCTIATADAERATACLHANPGLIVVTNEIEHPYVSVTDVKFEEGAGFSNLPGLVAYSGKVALRMKTDGDIICDIARLPTPPKE